MTMKLPTVEIHIGKRTDSIYIKTFAGFGPFSIGQEIEVQMGMRPDILDPFVIREVHVVFKNGHQTFILVVDPIKSPTA